MKLTALCFLISLFGLQASTSYSQKTVTLKLENVQMSHLLDLIESQTEYHFVYKIKDVDLTRALQITAQEEEVTSVLDKIFKDTETGYKIYGNQIFLTRKPTSLSSTIISANIQETITVTGTITETETGMPVPAANILEKGTSNGVMSDFDGNFSIEVPEDAILKVSYIGYATNEIDVNGRSEIDIVLETDAAALDEVLVVGYGTQKRAKTTGAISAVSGKELTERPVTNTAVALQGMSPGLTILNQGGAPGSEDIGVQIRGIGTLSNADPLVLVDGIEGSLGAIAPQNIESISVLKDAASAAIYGSRAANGVILITTKRGGASGTTISYNTFVGWQNPSFFPKSADPVTWLQLENEAQVNAGGEAAYSETYIENVAAGTNPLEYPFANWEEGVFNPDALMQQHSLSISSGGDAGRVFASLNFNDTDGIIQNFNNQEATMRINSDLYASEKLTFKMNLMYRNQDFSGPGFPGNQIMQGVLHTNRNVVAEYPDGTYDLVSGYWNPVAMVNEGETNRITDDVIAQAGFEYDFSESLRLEGDISYSSESTDGSVFINSLTGMKNYLTGEPIPAAGWFAVADLTESLETERELSQRLLLNYSETFGVHEVEALGGYEEIYNKYSWLSASRQGFFNNELRDLSAGGVENQDTEGYNQEWRLRSFFARLNYSFDSKYMLQVNMRYDGSSRFAEGNRWGVFPSFSAGWTISEEVFMQDVEYISNMKLRGSWGQLGNQNIGLYRFLNTYDLEQGYQFNNTIVPGAAVTSAGNPNISWETSTMTNIGLDMSFLNNRIEMVAEYFWKNTDEILLELPISSTIGVDAPFQNAAAVSNEGWELGLNYHSAFKPDDGFNYSVGVNLSDVVSTIEDLKGAGPFFPDKFSVWAEGKSVNSLRGLRSPGLYRTEADLQEYPATIHPNVGIGDVIYEDLNGDGVITQALSPDGDQYIYANEDPRYTFGVRFNASYKGFDFKMFWQGVLQQYHALDGALLEGPAWQNFITETLAENTFHPVRKPEGTWPLVTAGNTWDIVQSDFFLQDTKYARLKNIQLGYSIEQDWFTNFRIFVSGENLLTFTPTELFDPETPRGRSQFFPQTETISVGLNVVF